jgi:Protein of unknown function (DUF669)
MSHIGFCTNDYGEYTGGGKTILTGGDYIMMITADEFKPTKNGKGTGYLFDFQVCQGDRTGTTIKRWVNSENQSEMAERIGREEIKAIVEACGVLNPQDTNQIHNVPMIVTVEVEYKKDDKGNEEPSGNNFTKYKRLGEQPPKSASAPQQNSQQPPPNHPASATPAQGANGGAGPWEQ